LIEFDCVTKIFPSGKKALSEISFSVEKGETLALLGRSGCGKTSALRLINRLIEPTSGAIYFDAKKLSTIDPITLRRGIGYAIQHIGLFPHMTVEENVSIVPNLLKWTEKKIEQRAHELLEIVGLDPKVFSSRLPSQLSGGQKQRVGVARALAADPPVILMDEPFGALDPIMREQLQNEFLAIQAKIQKTVLFVTHDLSEAVKIGDRIAVMEKGEIVQIATPKELLEKPANEFVDAFIGKDRLLLMMQIETLKPLKNHLMSDQKIEKGPKIDLHSSLLESLLTFKQKKAKNLSVFDGDKYIGELPQDVLFEKLVTLIES